MIAPSSWWPEKLKVASFFSLDRGNQERARPHTEEIRITSPESGKSFAADESMQQIELAMLKK